MSIIPEGSNIFIIDLEYIAPFEKIDPLIEDHLKFLDKYYKLNVFIASGAKVPRNGGVILAVSETKSMIADIIKENPFHANNVANYSITEFHPSKASDKLR
ncbi:MAG: hypothetical protein COA52_10805 [Hyphomicrobiales bacterium]|nr:MAG: hypothetical protein COA52_10805 [Hyphomicrobiales bacterium]